jgi:hypothetical protein
MTHHYARVTQEDRVKVEALKEDRPWPIRPMFSGTGAGPEEAARLQCSAARGQAQKRPPGCSVQRHGGRPRSGRPAAQGPQGQFSAARGQAQKRPPGCRAYKANF